MADPETTASETIACWQRIDARITTSGRITADAIAALDAMGVRHVINLALADLPGALADEAELLAARGIRYTHIPVPFDAPEECHFAAFGRALDTSSDPVHVHCIMNWRVSAFFYRRNRLAGMPEPEAKALLARHWMPETDANPAAPAWARFIAEGDA